MSIRATTEHCKLCYDALLAVLGKKEKPAWPVHIKDEKTPIFVTWKIKQNLRGCIGTFSPGQHSDLIPQYAVIAALKDTRFKPMTLDQVNQHLSVSVSLLVEFEEVGDIYDWEVGKHGIIIKAVQQGQQYSATYLPEVAAEQHWDKQLTLRSLIRKAGFDGSLEQIKHAIKLTRYQSSKASLTFGEYLQIPK